MHENALDRIAQTNTDHNKNSLYINKLAKKKLPVECGDSSKQEKILQLSKPGYFPNQNKVGLLSLSFELLVIYECYEFLN